MDDLPPAVTPRFAIAFSILCIAFALAVVMATCTQARAQAVCAPLAQITTAWPDRFQENIVWEGTQDTEHGPLEFVLFQSDKGGWSLFVIQNGIACLRAAGKSGTDVGKGV